MRKPFTKKEKQFIIDNYETMGNQEIADKLNRTKSVIQTFASKKRLKKIPKIKTGDIFGKLTVEKRISAEERENGVPAWLCRCKCGNIIVAETNTLTSGHSSSCGCGRLEIIKSGYGKVSGTWYGNMVRNANKRGLKVDISLEFLDNLLKLQNYKCALSGLPIHIEMCRSSKKYYSNTTASLDRIDNSKGYIEGNVQWVHKHINIMKWNHKQDYFIQLCKTVTKFQDKSNDNSNS